MRPSTHAKYANNRRRRNAHNRSTRKFFSNSFSSPQTQRPAAAPVIESADPLHDAFAPPYPGYRAVFPTASEVIFGHIPREAHIQAFSDGPPPSSADQALGPGLSSSPGLPPDPLDKSLSSCSLNPKVDALLGSHVRGAELDLDAVIRARTSSNNSSGFASSSQQPASPFATLASDKSAENLWKEFTVDLEDNGEPMDHRPPNPRLTRSSSRILGATRTPSRGHPLRNVTTIGADNETSDYAHGSPQYLDTRWQSVQAVTNPNLQLSSTYHPQTAAEQASYQAPIAPRLVTQVAQNIPRMMGPEDISPTKHEEKLRFRERQYHIAANPSVNAYPANASDTTTTLQNQGGSPAYPRTPSDYGRSRPAGREMISDHIHPSRATTFNNASEVSQPASQLVSPNYTGQYVRALHAHAPLHSFQERSIQETPYTMPTTSTSISRTSVSTQMAAMNENLLSSGNETGRTPNSARRIAANAAINPPFVVKPPSEFIHDPFVTQSEPRAPYGNEAFIERAETSALHEFHAQHSAPPMAQPYQSFSVQNYQAYGPSDRMSLEYSQMMEPLIPYSLWDVPIKIDESQTSQSKTAYYPPHAALSPVPWPVTPAPDDSQSESIEKGKAKQPEQSEQLSRKIPSLLPSDRLAGIPDPETNPRVADTLTWFHTDNRGEHHLRQQIGTIARENRERYEREQIERGQTPTGNIRAEASNVILGHVLANLQSYLAGDREQQAGNFADWGPVPEHAIVPNSGGFTSLFEHGPNPANWGLPPPGAPEPRGEHDKEE
ncbi:hypothetical protein PRK78_006037 [Emydomyces testavorans]|uniref:Uncharacterized protein n=1 Tax=Emydomyces testavorans TaxID=2070801 RepID=A0AAF0IK41_9EURO|nr:hypothetical protein PRK78_006037 [Emydomyces testavorans]